MLLEDEIRKSGATVPHIQIPAGESWSPRNVDTPVSSGKTISSDQISGPRGTHPVPLGHRNQGTAWDRILLVSICTLELYTTLYTQSSPERTGLPGVLTHRLAGGTSQSQRQQDQMKPEITRWLEARART